MRARLCILGLVAAALGRATLAAQREGAPSRTAAEILLPAIAGRASDPAALRRELTVLGEDGAGELLEIAAVQRVVVRAADCEVTLVLRPALVELVLDSLAEQPPHVVSALFERTLARTFERGERMAALNLLARVARAGDLALALRLADASTAPVDPDLADAFERAAAACLEREPRSSFALEGTFADARPALAAGLVRAAAREGSVPALQRLSRLLGRRSDLDVFVLTRMAAVAEGLPPVQPDSIHEPVRAALASPRPEVAAAAAWVAGRLEDPHAAPRLCALLERDDPSARAAAHDALRSIAGRDLGPDPAAWKAWCDAETAWWLGEAPALMESALAGATNEARAATLALARRRLHRHEQAKVLSSCLERPEVEIAILAAQALGALGSPLALEPLERALRSTDARVVEAARRSLARIAASRRGA